jgi:anti-sigma factor RsiW
MTMRADGDTELLLHAYLDGELDAAATLDMERRLAADPALAGEYARLVALRQVIQTKLPRETAPQRLRDAVLGIAASGATGSVLALPARQRQMSGIGRGRVRLAMAAALVLGLALGSSLTYIMTGDGGTKPDISQVALDAAVAGHFRGLAAGMPFDVASSDRHTVKPWFAGKVNFAPEVVDLAENGFSLAGGRIDVIAGRTAATLVFHHDKHVISLTEAFDPSGTFKNPIRTTHDGFATVHWSAADIAYWAVSDAAPAEVDAFAAAFRAKAQNP